MEPRRQMMQDWADRLDLLEQGQVEVASAHLTIRIDGARRWQMARDSGDFSMCSFSAARAKWRSSATAIKQRT